MKRVLVLAYFFPPLGGGGTQRTLKLVRYLEPAGWLGCVVTARDPRYWILDPTLLEEIPPSTELLRVAGWTPHRGLELLRRMGIGLEGAQGERRAGAFDALRRIQSWFALPDGYAAWARAAERAAAARIEAGGIDAIWTTSSPESAHLAGRALRRRFAIPWVADFRDPWVGRITYRPPTRWHDRALRAMERSVIEEADRVTMISEALVERTRGRYPHVPPERFVFLPNGVDSDDWRRADLLAATIPAEPADAKRFVLLHAGQLAPRPSVRTLLEAVRRAIADHPAAASELRLRFVGGTEALESAMVRSYGLERVIEIRPAIPHVRALVAMQRATALLILGLGRDADALLYTGKIYEYLTSGRPVLALLDSGPAATLLERTGGGFRVPTDDIPGAARALQSLLERWRRGANLGRPPDPGLSSEWERSAIARQAAEILDRLAAAPRIAPRRGGSEPPPAPHA